MGQLGITQSLMKMGIRVDEIDKIGATPLYTIYRFIDNAQNRLGHVPVPSLRRT